MSRNNWLKQHPERGLLNTSFKMEVNVYTIPGIKLSDERIIEAVSKVYGVNPKILLVPSRKRQVVEPRQIAIFLIIVIGRRGVKYLEVNYPFDHATASYSIKTVKALYQASKDYRKNFTAILDDLNLAKEDRETLLQFIRTKINWGEFKQKYIQN